ncbi:MAG: replication and repair protein recF [Planctomycetota bacterium]
MRVSWAELRDFRNHALTRVEDLPTGLIVAVGPNGEGKTNLLEGLAFLFLLASPRTSASLPLVREGATAAYARGEIETRDGRVLVEVEIPGQGANRVQVNRTPVRRRRDLLQKVRAVFFGPDDLDVVRGDAGQRRRFLDEALTALWPAKASLITGYDRVVRQRNRLLKDHEGRGAPAGLDVWDDELVEAGAALTRQRAETVERIRAATEEEYEALATYGLAVDYAPNVAAAPDELVGAFRAQLADRRADELVRRTTLVGPHRDDVALAVRDLGVRSFASHGEAWAAALCLRLGLASAVAAEVGEPPVLLLDDPFSALDPARQRRISSRLASRGGQVFVSVADEASVPEEAALVWRVRGGAIDAAAGAA